MDLNLTMRYVMVQTQKEASGNSAKTEHFSKHVTFSRPFYSKKIN